MFSLIKFCIKLLQNKPLLAWECILNLRASSAFNMFKQALWTPAEWKVSPCFALLMCATHLLRPLYFKILDPPLYKYTEASILGGRGGGQSPHQWKYWGGKHIVLPPIILTTWKLHNLCNAKIGLKSTVRHNKAIKFNIKILLNMHNFLFYILIYIHLWFIWVYVK